MGNQNLVMIITCICLSQFYNVISGTYLVQLWLNLLNCLYFKKVTLAENYYLLKKILDVEFQITFSGFIKTFWEYRHKQFTGIVMLLRNRCTQYMYQNSLWCCHNDYNTFLFKFQVSIYQQSSPFFIERWGGFTFCVKNFHCTKR